MLKPSVSNKLPANSKDSVTVVAVIAKGSELVVESNQSSVEHLNALDLKLIGASPKAESLVVVPTNLGHFALLGVGDADRDLRKLGGAVVRGLAKFKNIVVDLPAQVVAAPLQLVEGALVGQYEYNDYRTVNKTLSQVSKLVVVSAAKVPAASLSALEITAASVHSTRDLVNSPPNDLYPAAFVSAVQKATRGSGVTLQIWDEKALKAGGFGGIAAVGQGSTRPPRLVKVEYKGKGAKKHLALVGKGITFDSGGLSLKPAESMVGMKYDMTGAATVFQAVLAIAKRGLPVHATAWLCLAENLPSGSATRPNDVIKMRNGKTVEVLNTDAEGRLVLADGLSIASEQYPDLIVDVATLTGAATIALGNRYAGLMGDLDAIELVQKAAADSGEQVWHMPLPTELRALLDSDIADLANAKIGNRAGGMLLGGWFLKEFIGKRKGSSESISWAHLDIAGPANNSGAAYGYTPKGASGVMVRTLVALAERLARG